MRSFRSAECDAGCFKKRHETKKNKTSRLISVPIDYMCVISVVYSAGMNNAPFVHGCSGSANMLCAAVNLHRPLHVTISP